MSTVAGWQPDVVFSHNLRQLEVDEALTRTWPTFKMMHGYFGACVSGHKAFSYPSVQSCSRTCGAGCLVRYLPRRCGPLRPTQMMAQYVWARRQQRLFSRYAGMVVASAHMRREYLRHGVAERQLHALPLFADEPGSPATTARDIDLLFLGRLTALKGPDVMLRAASRVAKIVGRTLSMVVAGDGPMRPQLERMAGAGGPSIDVVFPGWVDAAARAVLFSRARLVVIPSRWPEPFGLVGLEAAAAGVPAVGFDVGGIPEWLEHDVNGRLAAYDGADTSLAEEIAAALDEATRRRLAAGAVRAARRFNAGVHVAVLERVLAGTGPH